MTEVLKNYVNGAFVASSATETLDVTNPASGEVLSKVPLSTTKDVDHAVTAAKHAFEEWRQVPPVQRARYLFKLKELLEANKREIAEICTREHGKTLAESLNDLGRGIENVEHACGIPSLMMSQNLEDVASGIDCNATRQPLGVFSAVTPFNFPPMVPFWFLPYAIGTGNTFVLKVSEQVPMTWMRIAELIHESGLPKGVFNMVHGSKDVVQGLCTHPDIKGVSFVGSSKVAQIVYETAARHGKRVQALGGAKNHLLVMPDAVMAPSVQNTSDSAFGCAGQRCLAASVVVAVGDAYEPVREGLIKATGDIKMGFGLDEGVTMGPVISKAAKERILGYIDEGVKEGAELLVDRRSEVPAGYENGYWVGPCLFDKVKPGMKIATDEIFGPVLSLVHAQSFDEAVELMNSSPYGNAASIYTQSGKWAREFKYRADPAMLGINIGVAAPMAMFPFGGAKGSMYGDVKAHGPDAIQFYTERKVAITRWF